MDPDQPRRDETADALMAAAAGVADDGDARKSAVSVSRVIVSLLQVLVLLYVFLVGVEALSHGIKGLGNGIMDGAIASAANPFFGLVVGILATTLVQSSSVTTSLVVGMVASGQLGVAAAVPIVMGANIGTTVTNTIASLAHAGRSDEFKRAFAAATCHDFFNYLAVLTLLPVELIARSLFGVGALEALSGALASMVVGGPSGATSIVRSRPRSRRACTRWSRALGRQF